MHFKAAMLLTSWGELMRWMEKRGEEAAEVLTPYVEVQMLKDEGGFDSAVWDRTYPTDEKGWVTVRIEAFGGGSTFHGGEGRYDFEIKEEDWFSHSPLEPKHFRYFGNKLIPLAKLDDQKGPALTFYTRYRKTK